MSQNKNKNFKRIALLTDDEAALELAKAIDKTEENIPEIIKEEVKNIPLQKGDPGNDGKDYILTDTDKKEIATLIEVPIVEKLIERVETIKEQPIVTEKTIKIIQEVPNKDTANDIAIKLNTLKEAVSYEVLKDTPKQITVDDVLKELKNPKSKNRLKMRDIEGARLDMSDQRWHGGGLSNITGYIEAGTSISITGSGTDTDPYIINATSGPETDTLATVTARGATTSVQSTFSGGLITNELKASSSAGLTLKSNSGSNIALFGAGGGNNATFYGGVKLDSLTADRILGLDSSKNIVALDTATYPSLVELSYLKGIGGAINSTYLKLNQASQQIITGNPILSTLGYLVKDPSSGTKNLEISGYDAGGVPVYNLKVNNSTNYPQMSIGADGNIIINNSGGDITLEATGDWSLNDDRGIYVASDGTNLSLGNSVVGGKILANGYEIATLNTLSTYALTANVPILAPNSASRNLIQPTNATYKALILKGYTSQSANILELQDSSANPIAYFDQTGRLKIGQGTTSTTYDFDITRSASETPDIWLRLKTARSASSAAVLIDSGATGNPFIYMSRNGTTQWRILTNNSSNLEFYSYGTSAPVMTLTRATGAATFAQTINTGSYTVATLPTGIQGARAYVTNALAPTWGAAVVGGGTAKVPVFYDGTNWIVA